MSAIHSQIPIQTTDNKDSLRSFTQNLQNIQKKFPIKPNHNLQQDNKMNWQEFRNFWERITDHFYYGYIHLKSCILNLPLYRKSRELLDLIQNNDVVCVTTSTGSGKSTLLPPLLIAEGYKSIAITQPRRLPCRKVTERVRQTFGQSIAGWQVSGKKDNAHSRILYLTDGLLREWLFIDPEKIEREIIILDEVHERGEAMDVCIALLANYMKEVKIEKRPKIILSSATLDVDTIMKPFRELREVKLNLDRFNIEVKAPFEVKSSDANVGKNPVDVAIDLFRKRKSRNNQILCFLSSVSDVNQAVTLFNNTCGSGAYPLYAQQSPDVQNRYIEDGTIFFSTNIAETSLTFPCLQYVIDSGKLNRPQYDNEKNLTYLIEEDAPKSTLRQRKGRLGRTMEGLYYPTYDIKKMAELEYPKPKLLTVDLLDVVFSTEKACLTQKNTHLSLDILFRSLPNPPDHKILQLTKTQFRQLRIPSDDLKILPVLGSARITAAVYYGLTSMHCGNDMIRLAAILMSLQNNPAPFVKGIPARFSSPDGDYQSFLNLMHDLIRQSKAYPQHHHFVRDYCHRIGITVGIEILRVAFNKYRRLERAFEVSKFRKQASISRWEWEPVCRCLLQAFPDFVFGSLHQLQGDRSLYAQISSQRIKMEKFSEQVGILSYSSKVYRRPAEDPVPWLISTSLLVPPNNPDSLIISLAGMIKPEWISHDIKRYIPLTDGDIKTLGTYPKSGIWRLRGNYARIKGDGSTVLNTEIKIRTHLIKNDHFEIKIREDKDDTEKDKLNFETIKNMKQIFQPLKRRWKNHKQIEIQITVTKEKIDFKFSGRDSDCKKLKDELNSFARALRDAAVVKNPLTGLPPQRPEGIDKARLQAINERIEMVTSVDRTHLDLWQNSLGPQATRETRMAVVAWVAVCEIGCRLEGGFVRDWIIDGNVKRPHPLPPIHGWLVKEARQTGDFEKMGKDIIPADLDLQVSPDTYFDIHKFRNTVRRYGIECELQAGFTQGFSFVFDRKASTGPFTAEFIEPHHVATHDRVDFDVNNLYLTKDFSREIGIRVDISAIDIGLSEILEHIKDKKFVVLKEQNQIILERIEKMKSRGWSVIAEHKLVPTRPKSTASTTLLPASDPLYIYLANELKKCGGIPISMRLCNAHELELSFKARRGQIKGETKDENIKKLYHGTTPEAYQSVITRGFDNRFWKLTGMYGAGAYFADDITKSDGYTGNGYERYILYCDVILGNVQNVTVQQPNRTACNLGYHSILATTLPRREYIVYNEGQAKPYVIIKYHH